MYVYRCSKINHLMSGHNNVYVYRCSKINHLMYGHCNVESFTYESVTNVTYELASPDLQSRHYSR